MESRDTCTVKNRKRNRGVAKLVVLSIQQYSCWQRRIPGYRKRLEKANSGGGNQIKKKGYVLALTQDGPLGIELP